MGRYRIYPTKNTTILEDYPTINTGENEVMELWYGANGVTRHLVKFNTDDYNTKYNSGYTPHITGTTATFNMFNCYPIFEDSYNLNSVHATSVEYTIKMIQQDWSEGVGHDFVGLEKVAGYANWNSATTTTAWALAGGDFLYEVFSGTIDKGYENISAEVVDEIQLWDAFTGTDYGLSVSYTSAIEALSGDSKTVLKFFTRNTNTYYKPYIQFDWDSQITDQRDEVISGTTKKLYLYIKRNSEFTNLYSANSVVVSYDQNGGSSGWTATTINNPLPGFYYVEYDVPGSPSASTVFTDTWNVTYESGMSPTDIVQSGAIVEATSVWSSDSSDVINPTDYWIVTPDLKPIYNSGETIYLEVKNYTPRTNTNNILKTLDYRLDLVDGNNRFNMIGWEGVSYTPNDNFIMIDTDWLFTGHTYEISFRYTDDGSLIHSSEKKEFKLI